MEPKPIRIFLEDGSNDNNIYGGDWWIANQAMERSFQFMGYEVDHNWGKAGMMADIRRNSSRMLSNGSGRTGPSP